MSVSNVTGFSLFPSSFKAMEADLSKMDFKDLIPFLMSSISCYRTGIICSSAKKRFFKKFHFFSKERASVPPRTALPELYYLLSCAGTLYYPAFDSPADFESPAALISFIRQHTRSLSRKTKISYVPHVLITEVAAETVSAPTS